MDNQVLIKKKDIIEVDSQIKTPDFEIHKIYFQECSEHEELKRYVCRTVACNANPINCPSCMQKNHNPHKGHETYTVKEFLEFFEKQYNEFVKFPDLDGQLSISQIQIVQDVALQKVDDLKSQIKNLLDQLKITIKEKCAQKIFEFGLFSKSKFEEVLNQFKERKEYKTKPSKFDIDQFNNDLKKSIVMSENIDEINNIFQKKGTVSKKLASLKFDFQQNIDDLVQDSIKLFNSMIQITTETFDNMYQLRNPVEKQLVMDNLKQPIKHEEYESIVYSADFSCKGKYFASGSNDQKLIIYNNLSDQKEKSRVLKSGQIYTIRFFNYLENKLVTGGSEGILKFWDLNQKDEEAKLFQTYAHKGSINAVSLSENDSRVVSGGSDYLVKVWNTQDGFLLNTISQHTDKVTYVLYTNLDDTFISVSDDKQLKLWHSTSFECLNTIKDIHNIGMVSSIISQDINSRRIAIAGPFRNITIIDKSSFLVKNSIQSAHDHNITSVIFSKNNKQLISADEKGVIKFWNIQKMESYLSFQAHKSAIFVLSLSNEEKCLLSAGRDQILQLWHLS